MDSERLSARDRQPEHDQSFRDSERNFVTIARQVLNKDSYEFIEQPKDLSNL